MTDELFRKKALTRYLRVDAPGALLTIAPPWTLLVFGTMAALFVALVLLATFGHVQLAAPGRGVMRPSEPAIVIHAPFAATVLAVTRGPRAAGKAGDVILSLDARSEIAARDRCVAALTTEQSDLASLEKRLADWNDTAGHDRDASMALVLLSQIRNQREKTANDAQKCDALNATIARSTISFPVDATVEDVAVAAGSQVREGDTLATLIPASARMVGYVALGEQYRSDLATGMPVSVKFDALPFDDVGAGAGHVLRVLDALPSGVKIDTDPSATVFAEIGIDAMPSGAGAARTGMTFNADVMTKRARLLALVLGAGDGS